MLNCARAAAASYETSFVGDMLNGAIPAHRLHDVEEHRSSQIRAEVDEHGQDHHGQAERLLVVFLQHGRAVPAPGGSR